MRTHNLIPAIATLSFASVLALIIAGEMWGVVGTGFSFSVITVLLVIYLWTQIMRVRRVHAERWLLNPIVLCSFFTFFLGFGISNIIFFMPEEIIAFVGMVPDVTYAMFKLMCLVFLGALAMWMGYWSRFAANISNSSQLKKVSKRLFRSGSLQPWAVPALLFISILARLVSIQLGVFGYSSSYERQVEMAAITQYLGLLSSLGKLALAIVALEYFGARDNATVKWLFVGALMIEIVFGFLSGMKSSVVMPFIIVGACQYLTTERLPSKWVVFAFVGIFFAYQIIEPFRAARQSDVSFTGTSVTEISDLMLRGADKNVESIDGETEQTGLSILARTSMAYIGSIGIDFADSEKMLPEGSPNFLKDIFLAPAYAWVPRFVWADKPLADLGLWYTRSVLGNKYSISSTAMSPFTFLYFAGGAGAVLIGFFFIGIVQRSLWFFTRPYTYAGGAVVLLGVLPSISVIGDSFSSLIIVLFRELPLLVLLQRFLFRSSVHSPDCLRENGDDQSFGSRSIG